MNTEHLQDHIDQLEDELAALEKEQRRIPELLAEAVETFDRQRIAAIRERSVALADELFERRSDLLRRKIALAEAEREAAQQIMAELAPQVEVINQQIDELSKQKAPLVAEAQRAAKIATERVPATRRKLKAELEELTWAEKQRLQGEAAALVAPNMRALNVSSNPMLVL